MVSGAKNAGGLGAAHALREAPECIVLEPRVGASRSDKPTVRIFLGSEPAQYRAERIFIWSVECCRDPGRRYEIYLMKELAGFDRNGWTTSFTNHRFAIPHYAGGRGRAIYNDTDQIYLADPGELYDQDLRGHGLLAVSPLDSSVALIDCEKMAEVWTLEAAQRESKKTLLRRATEREGLFGRTDAGWNTRDHDEYDPERAKVYHFTTLATQPFRPFPERFVYQAHPNGELWYALERSADAEAFHPFTRERPSARYRKILEAGTICAAQSETIESGSFASALHELRRNSAALELRVSGVVAAEAARASGAERATAFSLFDLAAGDLPPCDGIVCLGGLDAWPDEDLGWMLDSLFRSAGRFVFAAVACKPTKGAGGMPPHGNVRDSEWWARQFESASRRRPEVHWELATASNGKTDARSLRTQFGGHFLGSEPPRVWVLADDRPGNTTQSTGLAEELGWPFEVKHLAFGPLAALHNEILGPSRAGLTSSCAATIEPPWPDLVIAAGGRTAPVARWIGVQSEGRTRLVQLGRKGGNPARHFDLSITPSYARLFPHPKRMQISLPLARVSPDALSVAATQWEEIFLSAREPRVALLVGGETAKHRLTPERARRIGEDVAEMVRKAGGSVFVTTSRRTPTDAVAALEESLPQAAHFHKWSSQAEAANPYLGYLALADAFVVTDDSESMLAEACGTQKPVFIYPLPTRPATLFERLKEMAVSRAIEKPLGERGTPKPQGGIELFLARLVETGLLRPSRDLASMRGHLSELGQARIFDGELVMDRSPIRAEMEQVADRVCELMGRERERSVVNGSGNQMAQGNSTQPR